MNLKAEYLSRLLIAAVLLTNMLVSFSVVFVGPASILPIQIGDSFLIALLLSQGVWGMVFLLGAEQPLDWGRVSRTAEAFFFFAAVLYLFAYIFAANANMDYIQRFAATSGELDLAADTRAERWVAGKRFLPSILVLFALMHSARAGRGSRTGRGALAGRHTRDGLYLVILSVVLSVLSVPSFVSAKGFGAVAWIMLVPLFVALRRSRPRRMIWFLLLYGVFFTLLGNYWLGTFSLVSLQLVGLIFFLFYLVFAVVIAVVLPRVQIGRWLVLPLAWTVFELARSSGFLGYPWLLIGHTQYRFLPALQFASVGGVWMVSFLVLVVNSLLAEGFIAVTANDDLVGAYRWWGFATAALLSITVLGALLYALPMQNDGSVRVALIQQNSDPRKHEYQETIDALESLTDQALLQNPDIVVWSETAFVPNIRRWSQEDPDRYRLAALVRDFLEYQRATGTWLLTGNDDYRLVLDDEGRETGRLNYNAAVLFDDTGQRRQTYHKMKLVPFTEYFPYEQQLPWVYRMLLDFDVYFWEPGEERTVFEHPKFRFASPVCFEDVFPSRTREFALAGAQVILNISNDYWSLTEVAGTQHFVAGMFRAVELRIPVLRATASGLTGYIDPRGRIIDTRPQYSREYLVTDVALDHRKSLYRAWGDWFPAASVVVLLILIGLRRKNGT